MTSLLLGIIAGICLGILGLWLYVRIREEVEFYWGLAVSSEASRQIEERTCGKCKHCTDIDFAMNSANCLIHKIKVLPVYSSCKKWKEADK